MPDRIRLDGKVAVVTGAAGVIGRATIKLLAERGARIVAVDRKRDELEAAIKDLPASAEPLAVTADVSDEDEVADYVRAAVDKFHAEGLKEGGRDNGAPGLRTDYSPTYYAAFLVDLDGNNVEAVFTG